MLIRKVLLHSACWLVWMTITSIPALVHFYETHWASYIVNQLSLVAVFYTLHLLSMRYFSKIVSKTAIEQTEKKNFGHYFRHWEMAAMLGVIACFIVISWFFDLLLLPKSYVTLLHSDL